MATCNERYENEKSNAAGGVSCIVPVACHAPVPSCHTYPECVPITVSVFQNSSCHISSCSMYSLPCRSPMIDGEPAPPFDGSGPLLGMFNTCTPSCNTNSKCLPTAPPALLNLNFHILCCFPPASFALPVPCCSPMIGGKPASPLDGSDPLLGMSVRRNSSRRAMAEPPFPRPPTGPRSSEPGEGWA